MVFTRAAAAVHPMGMALAICFSGAAETRGKFRMEFMELLRARQSVRRFSVKGVAQELVAQILEAVRTAPSAGNFQAYEIYVASGAARMQALADATFDHGWIAQAPMALVVCTNAQRCEYDGKEHWALQDASVAATLAHLAMANLGLASCWVGAFLPAKVAEALGVAEGHVPMAVLPFGYPGEVPEKSTRRALAEFVHTRE
jgi:nitroreductase